MLHIFKYLIYYNHFKSKFFFKFNMEVKQLSIDSNNIRLTKKNSSLSPPQKNLKKLIFQYHMKLKEQKDNMFQNNKNKDLILKIYKEKQNNLSLMTPFSL